jgi:hypothetical protein
VPEIQIVSVTRTRDEDPVAPIEAAATEGAEDEFVVELSGDLPAGATQTPTNHPDFFDPTLAPPAPWEVRRLFSCASVTSSIQRG